MKTAFCFLLTFISQLSFSQTTPLKGVTFGVGIGGFHLFNAPDEYSLSTDGNFNLQIQQINRTGIVISSVISIKFSNISLQTQTDGVNERTVLVATNRTHSVASAGAAFRTKGATAMAGMVTTNRRATFGERLALNISLNLAEINSDNLSFNKSIDGGLGIGYYFNEFCQISVLAEAVRVNQLRDQVKTNYEGKPIPNGNDVYNALDEKDKNLFTSRYFGGVAIKVIFTVGNK